MNAEKILAVEDTTYAVAKFNFMTSSQLGGSITQGWGRSRGRCRGLSFFLKNAFLGLIRIGLGLGLGLVLWLGLGLVSTITLTLTLKQRSFIKKRYTPIPIPIPTPRFTDTRPSWGSGFESRQPKLWRWVVKSLCNLRILFSSSKTSKGTPFQTTSAKFG